LFFLAKVNLEAELEFEWTALPHNTVHVLCQKHLDGRWFLAALDDTALGIACPDALRNAVPFVLVEHTTSRPPAVLPKHMAYARDSPPFFADGHCFRKMCDHLFCSLI
jgi:hypothetical protein